MLTEFASEEEASETIIKLTVLGESGVGKTNLLNRYFKHSFNAKESPTIGIESFAKDLHVMFEYFEGENQVKVEETVLLKGWDTAGQERFRALTNSIFQGTDGFVLVYDLTSKDSFDRLDYWTALLREKLGEQQLNLLLLGNKRDLEESRQVSGLDGQTQAEKIGATFAEVSAMINDENCVDSALDGFVMDIVESKKSSFIEKHKAKLSLGLSRKLSLKVETQSTKKCC